LIHGLVLRMLVEIQKILKSKGSAATIASIQKFVPDTNEKLYGVNMPVLNELAGKYKAGGFELVKELWQSGAFEEKILAIKMLGKIARKDPAQSFRLVKQFAGKINNWSVCDTIGMQALKQLVNSHQDEIFKMAGDFNRSKDPWQRRLSLVIVEWYTRKKELHPQIRQLVKALEKDEEYYVKKAITWINRNLEKKK
jgi:3-methyladenine DNA glycosylase AlkD